ncbi:hypothetical protein SAMN05877753_102735 [Bacillus oleivorans]|uniref:Uncharacterized protein n=1 Tax=Bacillus oleivorans TaxID=1448271 RepID=A0A285CMR6_9BACI|nr:DUF5957 family protein [Bacillus oleivorans]SNX68801.1 hypothetical protein SAMN05877753_102735 [Bacillus oleivorans]
MKLSTFIILSLAGGYITGIVLSELIGAISYLWFDQKIGIKFLPIYTAIISLAVMLLINFKKAEKKIES